MSDVNQYEVAVGNPAKIKGDIRNIKDRVSGEVHYPWRYHFDRAMPWKGYGFDEWFASLDLFSLYLPLVVSPMCSILLSSFVFSDQVSELYNPAHTLP